MDKYLQESTYINFSHPEISALATNINNTCSDQLDLIRKCFTYVRDEIKHSWDFKQGPLTCRASEALIHKTGFCFAKSHLLAALLRHNQIRCGLCYQRLSISGEGTPFSLHGLNAVYLTQFGWFRLDPRGNKPGVTAEFCPPLEKLAFPVLASEERDLPEIWAEPLPVVIDALENASGIEDFYQNLPDIELVD